MRMLMLVAIAAIPFGCAHSSARNLAEKQSTTTPSSDFDKRAGRDDSRHPGVRPVEPPIVTPPVP